MCSFTFLLFLCWLFIAQRFFNPRKLLIAWPRSVNCAIVPVQWVFNHEWILSSAPFDVFIHHSGIICLFGVLQPWTWGLFNKLYHCPCSVRVELQLNVLVMLFVTCSLIVLLLGTCLTCLLDCLQRILSPLHGRIVYFLVSIVRRPKTSVLLPKSISFVTRNHQLVWKVTVGYARLRVTQNWAFAIPTQCMYRYFG